MKTVSAVRRTKERAQLRQLREEANLTLREVAKLTGVSVPTISRIENGDSPPHIRTALRLAEFFETTVEDLFGGFK